MANTYSAGIATAYGAAVRGGYTGTYDEWCALMADYATVGESAEQAAQNAAASANAAATSESNAATSEQNAAASESAASAAATDATEARADAQTAAGAASDSADNAASSALAAAQSASAASASASAAAGDATAAAGSASAAAQTLTDVNAAGAAQINAIDAEGSTQTAAVTAEGQRVLASIPADYTDLSEDVSDLKSAIHNITGNDAELNFVTGKYIKTSGETATIGTLVNNASYACQVIDCNAGDLFTITGKGGSDPRLWAFLGAESNGSRPVLSKADGSITAADIFITAPANSEKLVVNVQIAYGYAVTFGKRLEKRVVSVEEGLNENTSSIATQKNAILYGGVMHEYIPWVNATLTGHASVGNTVSYNTGLGAYGRAYIGDLNACSITVLSGYKLYICAIDSDNKMLGTVYSNFTGTQIVPSGRYGIQLMKTDETAVGNLDGNTVVWTNLYTAIPKTTVLEVGTGKTYTTLNEAVAAIVAPSKTNQYEINIYPGEYETVVEADIDENYYGLIIPDYTSIRGIGSKDEIIINGTLPSATYAEYANNISTLEFSMNGVIENVTITSKNLRYCIHDDSLEVIQGSGSHKYKNVTFIVYAPDEGITTTGYCVGIGGQTDKEIIFEDCVFYTYYGRFQLMMHDNSTITKKVGVRVHVIRCKFIKDANAPTNTSCISVSNSGGGLPSYLVIEGCELYNTVRLSSANNVTTNCWYIYAICNKNYALQKTGNMESLDVSSYITAFGNVTA